MTLSFLWTTIQNLKLEKITQFGFRQSLYQGPRKKMTPLLMGYNSRAASQLPVKYPAEAVGD